MKNTINTLFALIIIATASTAQAQSTQSNIPNYIHLTAVARHSYSPFPPVANTIIEVQVEIWESTSDTSFVSPTQVYCELQHNIHTNSFGEFSIDFGDPSYICGSFGMMSGIPWSSGRMWYVLQYDSSTAGILLPIDTGRISSIPYAFAARTAENLINVGTPPATGSNLTWNGSAWVAGVNPWADYLIAEDHETAGATGGTATAGWNTRTLNTVVSSAGTDISLNTTNNSITLQPGTYYFKASAPAFQVLHHKIVLRDFSTSANYLIGYCAFNNSGDQVQTNSEIEGVYTFSTTTTVVISHYIQTPLGVDDLGLGFTAAGVNEVFAHVLVQRIK